MNQRLITRALKFNFPSLKEENINNICSKLSVNFSKDFLSLAKYVDFEYFNAFHIYSLLSEDEYSVINETLRLRLECGLHKETIFLFEDDASILLMRCCGTHEEVYWIAVEDFYNYCEGKPLEHNPTIFKSFPEFFEYLLNEEEKSRSIPA